MGLIRPVVMNARPGIIMPVLGGFVGTLLLTAGIFLAPLIGFPFIDIPHLMGGIFVANATAAFWIGFWLHFLAGAVLFPIAFGLAWPLLPRLSTGIISYIIKGLAWGLSLWVVSGALMPVAGWLNRLGPDVVQTPGFFGFGLGWKGVIALLAGHVAYGLAIGFASYMAANLLPTDTVGWTSYVKAELPPAGRLYEDENFPEYPTIGAR